MALVLCKSHSASESKEGKQRILYDSYYNLLCLTNCLFVKYNKILWRWDSSQRVSSNVDEPIFICSVDGTHCRICEPQNDPDTLWYSHKYKKPAVVYDIAIDLLLSSAASAAAKR